MAYKVKSLSVLGNGKRIYRWGEEVTEANFPPGNFPNLIKEGFIEEFEPAPVADPVSDEDPNKKTGTEKTGALAHMLSGHNPEAGDSVEKDPEHPAEETQKQSGEVENVPRGTSDDNDDPTDEDAEAEESEDDGETDPTAIMPFDKIGVRKLRKALIARGIPFDKTATKEQLYTLYSAKN